jgi:hypothetical protein
MRTVLRDREAVILELSAYEMPRHRLRLGPATLLPLGEGDNAFPRRFGWPNAGEVPTRQELRSIEHRLPKWHDDETVYTEGFSRRELTIVVRSLSELANGVQIPEWEFHTLTGAERQDVRDLLHASISCWSGRKSNCLPTRRSDPAAE